MFVIQALRPRPSRCIETSTAGMAHRAFARSFSTNSHLKNQKIHPQFFQTSIFTSAVREYYSKKIELHEDSRITLLCSAKNGSPQAQYLLGIYYLLGKGGAQDKEQASAWLKLAAKTEPEAYVALGDIHLSKKETVRAYLLYKLALQHKEMHEAQLRIGKCYEVGWGVRVNRQKALQWYHKALANGSPVAKEVIREFKMNPAQRVVEKVKATARFMK